MQRHRHRQMPSRRFCPGWTEGRQLPWPCLGQACWGLPLPHKTLYLPLIEVDLRYAICKVPLPLGEAVLGRGNCNLPLPWKQSLHLSLHALNLQVVGLSRRNPSSMRVDHRRRPMCLLLRQLLLKPQLLLQVEQLLLRLRDERQPL